MNRDIKFRAFNTLNNEMMRDIGFRLNPRTGIPHRLNDGIVDAQSVGIVFMQFTGLKDEKGVEIYEDDVIRDGQKHIGRVAFFNGAYVVEFVDDDDRCDLLYAETPEVIGNIHQNPDLLNTGETNE